MPIYYWKKFTVFSIYVALYIFQGELQLINPCISTEHNYHRCEIQLQDVKWFFRVNINARIKPQIAYYLSCDQFNRPCHFLYLQ